MQNIAQPRLDDPVSYFETARQQITRRIVGPILREIVSGQLRGRTKFTADALIKVMPLRLRGKRPSINRALLGMALTALDQRGRMPSGVEVLR